MSVYIPLELLLLRDWPQICDSLCCCGLFKVDDLDLGGCTRTPRVLLRMSPLLSVLIYRGP